MAHAKKKKTHQSIDDQVHNISPVIAEWDFKLLFGDPRDEARFRLTPKGGSLHKDQRVNVQVDALETTVVARTVQALTAVLDAVPYCYRSMAAIM